MIDVTIAQHSDRLSRQELESRGARFCGDCDSHHEYALLEGDQGLAAYRMQGDEGRRVAEAADAESAAQLGRLVERVF